MLKIPKNIFIQNFQHFNVTNASMPIAAQGPFGT